jgi:hypothetical protein
MISFMISGFVYGLKCLRIYDLSRSENGLDPGGAFGPARINATTGRHIIEISKSVGGAIYIYENEYLIWIQFGPSQSAAARRGLIDSAIRGAYLRSGWDCLGQRKGVQSTGFELQTGVKEGHSDH